MIVTLFLGSCNHTSNNVLILSSAHTVQAEIDSLAQILLEEGKYVNILAIEELTAERLTSNQTVVYHRSDSSSIEQSEIDLK